LLGWDKNPLPKPACKRASASAPRSPTTSGTSSFMPAAAQPGDRLVIDQILDDGAVYYLNGKEIGRSRMPAGPVQYRTLTASTVRMRRRR